MKVTAEDIKALARIRKIIVAVEAEQEEGKRMAEVKQAYENRLLILAEENRELKTNLARADFDNVRLLSDVRDRDRKIEKLSEKSIWKVNV